MSDVIICDELRMRGRSLDDVAVELPANRRLVPWLLRAAIRRGILQWLLVEKIHVP